MSEEKDLIEFDDTEAIRFIMNTLTEEQRKRIDEETVQYILDLICEYYDQNGLIEEDTVDEAEIAEDDIFNFVACRKRTGRCPVGRGYPRHTRRRVRIWRKYRYLFR